MRLITLIGVLSLSSIVGCATETNITRTVTMPDGKVEVYENKSKGFNYNPNFTGTSEQSVHVRDYGYGNNRVVSPFYGQQPTAPYTVAADQFNIR